MICLIILYNKIYQVTSRMRSKLLNKYTDLKSESRSIGNYNIMATVHQPQVCVTNNKTFNRLGKPADERFINVLANSG